MGQRRKKALFITGWAHGVGALPNFERALSRAFDLEVVSPSALLAGRVQIEPQEIVLGWSLGAMLALQRCGEFRPERLVLLAPTPRFIADSPGNTPGNTPGNKRHWSLGVPQKEVRALRVALKKSPERALQGFATLCYGKQSVPVLTEGDEQGLIALEELDLLGNLESPPNSSSSPLNVPTLVLHGERDRVIPWQAGAVVARLLPNAIFSLWPGGEHAFFEHSFVEGEHLENGKSRVVEMITWFVQ